MNTTQHLTFTDAERLHLDGLRKGLALHLRRAVTLETCAEDGDEWALLALPDEGPAGFEPLVSVQLATKSRGNQPGPRRRVFDLVGPKGRTVPRVTPTDDLAALLPVAHRAAMVAYRALA